MSCVLILGGTGAIGVYLVPALLGAGHEVHVTTRNLGRQDRDRLRYLHGDARDLVFLDRITKHGKYDAIIDLMVYSTLEFKVAIGLLLERTAQYFFVSSYRVFADTGARAITERSPRLLDVCKDQEYLATDEYALAKARQEDILRASDKNHWTIVRPCITYSTARFQFGTLEANTLCLRALQGLPVIMPREILSKQTTMTWAGDVARMMAKLTLNKKALGEDFNVVTSEHHTWEEIGAFYKEFIELETVPVKLDVYIQAVRNPYQVKYDRMLNRVLDNAKILSATGLEQTELRGTREGLQRELEAFKQEPYFQYPDLALNARIDKITGTRLSLREFSRKQKLIYAAERLGLYQPLRGVRSRIAGKIPTL